MASAVIPLFDMAAHTAATEPFLRKAFERVLKNHWFILGPAVREFEEAFASFCQSTYCVSVASGTDALEIALRSLELGRGDEVITVANAGMYSSCAIVAVGALPVYVDIDPDTMTLSPHALEQSITARTKAIVATHLYGQMADMPSICSMAAKHGLPVIEDCAQAHGASISGRTAGSWGCIGCFSFYPTKNLGAIGDGGAIVTNDVNLAQRAAQLRQYGWNRKYSAEIAGGTNSRLDELQAAVLKEKLRLLVSWNEARRHVVDTYRKAISSSVIRLPIGAGTDYVAHLCVIRTPNREALRDELAAAKITTEVHYPIPDYRQPALAQFKLCNPLPNTELAAKEVLSIPCYPELTNQQILTVAEALSNSQVLRTAA